MLQAYLAGLDVFLPHAHANAAAKITICARYGILGRAPLNDDNPPRQLADQAWQAIFHQDLAMMTACDIIIANLTPFRAPRPMPAR